MLPQKIAMPAKMNLKNTFSIPTQNSLLFPVDPSKNLKLERNKVLYYFILFVRKELLLVTK